MSMLTVGLSEAHEPQQGIRASARVIAVTPTHGGSWAGTELHHSGLN